MTTERMCGNGCGKPVAVRGHGPKPKYCGDACRQAAHRRAAEDRIAVSVATPVTSRAPSGSSAGGRRIGLLCPADPSHGPLIPWTGNPRWGWHCPHQDHDGWGDRPRIRPFFTTEEAETGVLAVTPATQPTVPTHEREATQLALRPG